LPKKIKFQLLPADLALQILNTRTRRREIPQPHRLRRRSVSIHIRRKDARPTSTPQPPRPAPPEPQTPLIQMTARNMQLTGERFYRLPSHHPLDRCQLELSAEFTTLAFGHRSSRENCLLFSCLILGVHSNPWTVKIARAPPEWYDIAAWPAAAHDAANKKARRGFPPGRNSSVSIK
jgi:hypothetical protein